MAEIANKSKSKGRGNPAWKRGGRSPNPKGRPAEGQSWAGVLRDVTDRTAEEMATMCGGTKSDLGRALLMLPRGVAIKYLIAARAITALMFDPTAGLMRVMLDAEDNAGIEERLTAIERTLKL